MYSDSIQDHLVTYGPSVMVVGDRGLRYFVERFGARWLQAAHTRLITSDEGQRFAVWVLSTPPDYVDYVLGDGD